MKSKAKRILAAFLALCMVVTTWTPAMTAEAETETELVNVALDATASTNNSTSQWCQGIGAVNDGNSSSYYESPGEWPTEVALDLNGNQDVSKVVVKSSGDAAANKNMQVTVKYAQNGITSVLNTLGQQTLVFTGDMTAEFVVDIPVSASHIYVTLSEPLVNGAAASYWPRIAEIEVYELQDARVSNYNNIADQAVITTTGTADATEGAANLVDENDTTLYKFHNAAITSDQTITLSYDEARAMDAFRIRFENVGDTDADNVSYVYSILAKNSEGTYETIAQNVTANRTDESVQKHQFTEKVYSEVQLVIHSCTSAIPAIAEFEVYGSEAAVTDAGSIAWHKPVHASSGRSMALNITDGNKESVWRGDYYPAYVDIDLEANYDIEAVEVYTPENGYSQYSIYTSLDGRNFTKFAEKTSTDSASLETGEVYQAAKETEARIVRVYLEYNSAETTAVINEVRVIGKASGTEVKQRPEIAVVPYSQSTYANKTITAEDTYEEVYGIIERRLGADYKSWFTLQLAENPDGTGYDYYDLSIVDGKVLVKGNDGVSLASGINHYLKYYCNVNISQVGDQVKMPAEIPTINGTVHKETKAEVRYSYNYCTLSYSMAFWGEKEWRDELDWLALNGVNVVLDATAQEEVWRRFLGKLGYEHEEIKDFIAGPAYYAWAYMANLSGFGGPVHDSWFEERTELARKNQEIMQKLGMQPVLQGYSGMVPTDIVDYAKGEYAITNSDIIAQGGWNSFQRPAMLVTTSEIFDKYAELFYQCQEEVYGDVSDYYATDPFHEGGITGGMSASDIAQEVLTSMLKADKDSIWIIQAWEGNPKSELLRGLDQVTTNSEGETIVGAEHALVLDLYAEKDPHHGSSGGNSYGWEDEFDSTPWLFCMLNNFGGRLGLHGHLDNLANNIPTAFNTRDYIAGIGITPEASVNNPVLYDFLFETIWQDDASQDMPTINLDEWLDKYAERRYGAYSESANEAWTILKDTVYKAQLNMKGQGAPESVVNARPALSISAASTWGNAVISYDKYELEKAAALLLEDYETLKSSEGYLYDVATVLQQILSNSAQEYQKKMAAAFNGGDLATFEEYAATFMGIIDAMEQVTSTSEYYLLGRWVEQAKALGKNADDFSRDLYEFNAKALITTWGSKNQAEGGRLKDYSNRQWSGLINDFYKARWERWITARKNELKNEPYESSINWFEWEWSWVRGNKVYPTTPTTTDLSVLGAEILQNYSVWDEAMDDSRDVNPTTMGVTAGTQSSGDVAGNVLDGNQNSIWHSNWSDGNQSTRDNHYLIFTFNEETTIDGMRYLQRSDGVNGAILKYDLYVSTSDTGDDWTLVVDDGTFENNTSWQLDSFEATEAKRAKLVVVDAMTGETGKVFASAAEIRFTTPQSEEDTGIGTLVTAGTLSEYDNIANQSTIDTTGTEDLDPQYGGPPANLVDGNTSTLYKFHNDKMTEEKEITLTYDELKTMDAVKISFEKMDADGYNYQFKYSILAQKADGTYDTIVANATANRTNNSSQGYTFPEGEYSQIKIVMHSCTTSSGAGWPSIAEFEIYGTDVDTTPEVVNKTALQEAIAEVESLNADDYTAESWTALQVVLATAIATNENDSATQEEVDEALADLQAAKEALELKTVVPDEPEVENHEYITILPGYSVTITDNTGKYGDADLTEIEEDIATVTVQVKDAQRAKNNSDSGYTGEYISLEDCLYTFTEVDDSDDDTYVFTMAGANGSVFFNPGTENNREPHNNAAVNVTVETAATGEFYLSATRVSSGAKRYVYFNDSQMYFDSGSNTNANANDKGYKFLLFKQNSEANDPNGIPGYEKVTNVADIKSGEKYLIVANTDNGEGYYAAYPTTSTEYGNYTQIAKVLTNVNETEITFNGVEVGNTEVTIGKTRYHINVVEAEEETVTVKVGDTIRIFDQSGIFSEKGLEGLDSAKANVTVESITINDKVAKLYKGSSYDGDSIDLNDCIYSFNRNADGTYTISATTADGTRVYLNPRTEGQVGYPNSTTAEKIVVTAANGGFVLKDYSDKKADGENYCLTYKQEWSVFNEEETEGVTTVFKLYELKKTTTTSGDVYEYVPVTEVRDGGQYVIMAEFTDTDGNAVKYALRPSNDFSTENYGIGRNSHVARVTDETVVTTGNEILVRGISEGQTSVTVGTTKYNINVVANEEYITLIVGESMSINGMTVTQTPDSQYVTTGTTQLVKVESLADLEDAGEYIIVPVLNTDKAVSKNSATGKTPSGLQLTTKGNDFSALYWRIVRNSDGTYSIQDNNTLDYINFATGSGSSSAVSLGDDVQKLTIEELSNTHNGVQYDGFGIKYGSMYLNCYGGVGNDNAAGYNGHDAASTWYIYKPVTEITGAAAGETTAVIDGITYHITVVETQVASGIGTSTGKEVNRLTISADNTFDLNIINSNSTNITWKIVNPDGTDADWATITSDGQVSATNKEDHENTYNGYIIATVDGQEFRTELKVSPAPTATNKRLYDVYIGELHHTDVYYGWVYEYDAPNNEKGYGSTDLTQVVEGEVIYVSMGSDYDNALDFFAKPEEGYALTQMGATGSQGHYMRLEGQTATDTEFMSPTPGITDVNSGQHPAGYQQYMRYDDGDDKVGNTAVTALVQKAMDMGCHGAQGFTRYGEWGDGGTSSILNYRSEKLPTVKKEVVGILGANGLADSYREYTEGMTAQIGEYVYFHITVDTYDAIDEIMYSNMTLNDKLEGATFFVQDADKPTNEGATNVIDITDDISADGLEGKTHDYYVVYQIQAKDIVDISHSITNTVDLSFNYATHYSNGVFGGAANDNASVLITDVILKKMVVDFGLSVTYTFETVNEFNDVENVETVYGKATITSELDATKNVYVNKIVYTPTTMLQGADAIPLTEKDTGTVHVASVYPATSVYYEEGFADYEVAEDGTSLWGSAISKGNGQQAFRYLDDSLQDIDNYGYDDKYADEVNGPSNGSEAVSNVAGSDANFTFTGTGVDIYANSQGGEAPTGTVSILMRDTKNNNAIKKLMIVDTKMAGDGAVSSQHDGITAYNVPIVSANDLGHSTYSVAIRHTSTTTTDEDGNKVVTTDPVRLDGFRVYNTLADSSIFESHNEANPNFVEMRNVVLNALTLENVIGDAATEENKSIYAEDIAGKLTQVLDKEETGTGVAAVILAQGSHGYADGNAQDLLDNGPKNELFLYPGQTLVFNLAAGVKNAQIGMRAVNTATNVTVQKGEGYILGTADAAETITTSTDMFYKIGDITDATSITITNTGTGILSITDLKYFVATEATQVFGVIEEEDLVPVLNSMGFISKLLNPFKDIIEGSYFYDAVLWAVKEKITDGWTATQFAPDMNSTRGQVVTFLWRAAGKPVAKNTENPFTDVVEGSYYYDAVLWAVEKGITDGWTATTFAPDMECTRGQILTFIWRAAGEPKAEEITNAFTDVAENAYYRDAVLWAVEKGITNGWTATTFAPDMDCTRAQIVTFLFRAK